MFVIPVRFAACSRSLDRPGSGSSHSQKSSPGLEGSSIRSGKSDGSSLQNLRLSYRKARSYRVVVANGEALRWLLCCFHIREIVRISTVGRCCGSWTLVVCNLPAAIIVTICAALLAIDASVLRIPGSAAGFTGLFKNDLVVRGGWRGQGAQHKHQSQHVYHKSVAGKD